MEVAVWRQGNLEVLLGGGEGLAQPGLGPTDASAATRRSGRTYRSRGPGRPLHAPLDGGLAAPAALPVVQQAQHPRALGHAGLERLAAVGCDRITRHYRGGEGHQERAHEQHAPAVCHSEASPMRNRWQSTGSRDLRRTGRGLGCDERASPFLTVSYGAGTSARMSPLGAVRLESQAVTPPTLSLRCTGLVVIRRHSTSRRTVTNPRSRLQAMTGNNVATGVTALAKHNVPGFNL